MVERRQRLEDGTVDLLSGVVRRQGHEVRLSNTELRLFAYLTERPGEVVSRERLLTEVWGYAEGIRSRTVDVTMARLRKKVEADPSEPRHLVTVVGEGYRFVPPSRDEAPPTNLPAAVPELVGRHRLLSALDDLLESGARQITLQGPGGVGKTALARAWAVDRRERFPGGAWFCPLDELGEAMEVRGAVADVLGTDDVEQALRASDRALLVLDAAEHLAGTVRSLVQEWAVPTARFLVTSRIPLQVEAEHVLAVPPLPPGEAEALLLVRAREVRPLWEPDASEREALRAVAEALDGLPLALELAAARLRVLSPRQVQRRLDERFALLRRGETTLQATLDWAWERLDDDERVLVSACAVFQGGFTAEAAEGVLGADLDALDRLVDHSLLQVRAGDPVRFDLLENVRAFVEDRRREGAEEDLWRAHAAWYLARAEQRPWGEGVAWLREERANLLAVHRRFLSVDPPLAGRALLALIPLLETGPGETLIALFERTLEALEGRAPGLSARLYLRRIFLWYNRRDLEQAWADVHRGLSLAEEAGDRATQARLLARGARVAEVRDESGEQLARRAMELAREAGVPAVEAHLHRWRAAHRFKEGRVEAACACLGEAIRVLGGRPGHEGALAGALLAMAQICMDLGRHGEAEDLLDRAEGLYAQRGDEPGIAAIVMVRGVLALDRGRLQEGRERLEAARTDLRRAGEDIFLASVRRNLALARLWEGDRRAAFRWARSALEVVEGHPEASPVHAIAAVAAPTRAEREHHLQRARATASIPQHHAFLGVLCGDGDPEEWRERSVLVRLASRVSEELAS